VRDRNFEAGLNLEALDKNDPQYDSVKIFDFNGAASGNWVWDIFQWGTRFDLRNAPEVKSGSKYIYQDESKKITVQPGSDEFSLRVLAQNVYDAPRQYFEDWPHLYLEQDFADVQPIGSLKSLTMEIEYQLTYYQDYMTPQEYNPTLHSAQFQWIVTLINKEKFYGAMNDYLWFNFALYDQRDDITSDYYLQDGGKADATDKFIYSKGMEGITDQKVSDGGRIKVSRDILSDLKNAFATAQSQGFLQGCVCDLMRVNYMNIGWEVTGTFDVEMTVYNMSLKYELLDE